MSKEKKDSTQKIMRKMSLTDDAELLRMNLIHRQDILSTMRTAINNGLFVKGTPRRVDFEEYVHDDESVTYTARFR